MSNNTQTHNPPGGGGGGNSNSSASSLFSHTIKGNKQQNPLPLMIVGALLMCFWFSCSLIEVQATEAWVVSSPTHSFLPDWTLLGQIPMLFGGGKMDQLHAQAALLGWGVEFVTLAVVVGFDIAKEGVSQANKDLLEVFQTMMVVIVLFNLVTNFQYGSVGTTNFLGHLIFAVLLSFVSWFFGIVGFRFMELGWKTWRKK